MGTTPAITPITRGDGYTLRIRQPDRPDITIDGGTPILPTLRTDGSIGMRAPRNEDEQRLVTDNNTIWALLASTGFWEAAAQLPGNLPTTGPRRRGRPPAQPTWVRWAMACAAGLFGSQNASVAYFADPITWEMFRHVSTPHLPEGWLPAPETPPTRSTLRTFQDWWQSPEWEHIRANTQTALFGAGLQAAKSKGHYDPDQPLSYNDVDYKQWAICDGTVLDAPASRNPQQCGAGVRIDPASGMHTHAGATKYGSKFVLAETVSSSYRGRFIIAAAHVTPKPGNTVGDEAAATVAAITKLKQSAPGLRGLIIDGAFRGTHIKQMYDLGIVTVNRPAALANPNRATGGVTAPGREETSRPVRIHRHTLPSGYVCEHNLYLIGSVLHEEKCGDDGETRYEPLPTPRNGYARAERFATRWYTEHTVPCPDGDTTVLLRLDAPGKNDYQNGSRTELARFYPTNSEQFAVLYGRRNATESVHRQYKRRAERVPAFGVLSQTLYVLGYVATHNAVAEQLQLRADGKPNVFRAKPERRSRPPG